MLPPRVYDVDSRAVVKFLSSPQHSVDIARVIAVVLGLMCWAVAGYGCYRVWQILMEGIANG